jgi:hypothetical protein
MAAMDNPAFIYTLGGTPRFAREEEHEEGGNENLCVQ